MTNRNIIEYFKILSEQENPQAFLNSNFIFLDFNKMYLDFFKVSEKDLFEENFFMHFKHLAREELEKLILEFEEYKNLDKFIYRKIEVSDKLGKIKKIEFKLKYFQFQTDSFYMISFKEVNSKFNPSKIFPNLKKPEEEIQLKLNINSLENFLIEQKNYIQIVAHEITSPIGAIKSLIEILESKTLLETEKKHFEMIQKSLDIILNSGSVLLELSEKNSDSEQKKDSVDLVSFLKEILEKSTPLAYQKNITLVFNSNFSEYFFEIQKDKLSFVISTLISEAISNSSEDKKVELHFFVEKNKPVIFVLGEGDPNLNEKEIPKNYFKLATNQFEPSKSIGMGLVLSKEILEKNGASLSYEKISTNGNKFVIRF